MAGAAVPVFGIPVIAAICIVSLSCMAYGKYLIKKEKALRNKFDTFITTVQWVMIGLDSIVPDTQKAERSHQRITRSQR
jgi:hypothetical protein